MKYFLSLVLIIFMFVFVYAKTSVKLDYSDCKNIEYYKVLGEDLQKFGKFNSMKIFKKNIYDTALKNLEKYCNGNTKNVLPSSVFFNHLMDVGFRVLDGFGGIYSYGLSPDSLSKQRRDYLNNIMKEYETKPQDIKEKFEKLRGNPDEDVVGNEKTIYGKYLLFCDELVSLGDKLISKATDNIRLRYYSANCKKLAKNRYVKESYLVQRIMFMNVYNHINKILYKGFVQKFNNKWAKLYDKFLVLLGNYEYVVRRFVHATDVNTK